MNTINFLCVCLRVCVCDVCVLTAQSDWLPFPNTCMFVHKSFAQSPERDSTLTTFQGGERREWFTRYSTLLTLPRRGWATHVNNLRWTSSEIWQLLYKEKTTVDSLWAGSLGYCMCEQTILFFLNRHNHRLLQRKHADILHRTHTIMHLPIAHSQYSVVIWQQAYESLSRKNNSSQSLEQPWSCLWVGWDLCHQTTKHWFIFKNFTPEQHYSNSLISYWFRTHNSYLADWYNFYPTRLCLIFCTPSSNPLQSKAISNCS